jgi:hypothetical protein
MNRAGDLAAIEELMKIKRMPTAAQIKDGKIDFVDLLKNS